MASILVIDADNATRKLVEQTLRPAGHLVLSAASRSEGVELSRRHAVDVAILCLYLPNEAGMNTEVDCFYESPGVEIIGFARGPGAGPRSAVAGWRGATISLTKPLERRDLLKAVDEVLSARRFAPLLAISAPQPSAGELGLAQRPNLHPPPRHGSHPYH
jgi:DNA-binding NtrC family response regulator